MNITSLDSLITCNLVAIDIVIDFPHYSLELAILGILEQLSILYINSLSSNLTSKFLGLCCRPFYL